MDAREVLARLDFLKADRSAFEAQWNRVDEWLGGPSNFGRTPATGERRGRKMFDSEPMIAADRYGSILSSLMTPQTETWHKLEIDEKEPGKKDREADGYLEEINEIIFRARYAPKTGFPSQSAEAFNALGRYGVAIIAIMDLQGLRYRNLPLSETYIDVDWQGEVDTVIREYQMTARQAMQAFGDKCPERVKTAAANSARSSDKFTFVQMVAPNRDMQPGRLDSPGMPWASVDVCVDAQAVVGRGGYREFPFAVARIGRGGDAIYRYSPAMMLLPSLGSLNEMKKTILRAGQNAVEPVVLTGNDGVLQGLRLSPGAVVPGGVSPDGKRMVETLHVNGDIPVGLELMDRESRVIRDGFLVSLFEILATDRRQMTAQEVLQRSQEKGDLLGPIMGELQQSFFGPMIVREIGILTSAGAFPDPPQSIIDRGGAYSIRYSSPVTRAQQADKGIAVMRTLEVTGALSQFDPSVKNRIDADAMLDILTESIGLPSNALRSRDAAAKISEAEAQQIQGQQLLAAAPVAAQAAKTMTEAQQMARVPGL